MKYKVGDRVRIVPFANGGKWNQDGKMDRWLGKVMTVRTVGEDFYRMEEDYGTGTLGNGWCWYEHMIDSWVNSANRFIRITQSGQEVTASMYDNDGCVMKTASVKCPQCNVFNFGEQAKLALEELTSFVPYLAFHCGGADTIGKVGKIGEEVHFTALFGEKLFVGDTVEVYSTNSDRQLKNSAVCKDEDGIEYVMGLMAQKFICGVAQGWQIRKVDSYKNLKHGQKIDSVTAILTEDM